MRPWHNFDCDFLLGQCLPVVQEEKWEMCPMDEAGTGGLGVTTDELR